MNSIDPSLPSDEPDLRGADLMRDNHDRLRDLRSIALHLTDLSHAFYTTGNHEVGKTLVGMASDIREHVTAISGNISEDLNLQITQGQVATSTILAAVFSGMELENTK